MNILTGGDNLGQWMVEHPDIVHISFTGSQRTGSQIIKTGADRVKKVSLTDCSLRCYSVETRRFEVP